MLKTIFRNITSFATMNQVPAQLYIGQLKESFVIFLLKTNARQIGDFLKAILKWAKQNMMQQKEKCLKKQGLHIRIQLGYEGISKYKLRNNVDKKVSIFVATTDDMRTIVQEEEIDDFMWLAYDQAIGFLSFENDKKILREAVDFLLKNNLIVTKDIPLPQDVQKEMEIKEKLRQERIAQMERQKQFNPPQKSKQQIRYENYKKKQKQKYKENLKKSK